MHIMQVQHPCVGTTSANGYIIALFMLQISTGHC